MTLSQKHFQGVEMPRQKFQCSWKMIRLSSWGDTLPKTNSSPPQMVVSNRNLQTSGGRTVSFRGETDTSPIFRGKNLDHWSKVHIRWFPPNDTNPNSPPQRAVFGGRLVEFHGVEFLGGVVGGCIFFRWPQRTWVKSFVTAPWNPTLERSLWRMPHALPV